MEQIKYNGYLSGAYKNISANEQNAWRDEIQTIFSWREDVKLHNPNSFFNYYENYDGNICPDRQVKNHLLWLLIKSDFVIVNLDNSDKSVETGIECEIAKSNNIPVIGFGLNKETWNGWTKLNCDIIFNNLNEVFEYISEYYLCIK